ncbi:hypothetical protein [Sinanaerobacter sp. ZZT-01]|uniref:hypothetical protein n=1 Tax=Sinanaerobacter sp. ZZT-01 TaxID=3111540 RepID=UPI002D78CBB2|nr:hypothetical protein [Sinanaerobacter sp. ZZT-01]WRR94974.1 hypothetical protein U5921_07590 [Sinanaerobacter sp. ZZT-01]
MKKLYVFLVVALYFTVSLFCGLDLSLKENNRIANDFFNGTIMVKQKSNPEQTLKSLKEISDGYGLTLAKISPYDEGTDLYIYSSDGAFEKSILGLNPLHLGMLYTNKKEIADSDAHFDVFSNKKIKVYPLDDLDEVHLMGRYSIYTEDISFFSEQIDNINLKYGNSVEIYENRRLFNVVEENYSSLQVGYLGFLVGLLNIIIVVTYLYRMNHLKRSFAIKKLCGYSNQMIFSELWCRFILKPIGIALLFSYVFSIGVFIVCRYIDSVNSLLLFLKKLTLYNLAVSVALMLLLALFTAILLQIFKAEDIIRYLKHSKKETNKLNFCIIALSMVFVLLSSSVLYTSADYVIDRRSSQKLWEKNKDLVTLHASVTSHILDDTKESALFEKKLTELWKYFYKEGGILFHKRKIIEVNKQEIPLIYINKSYLKENAVLDVNGKRILDFDESDDNNISVLVPERYRGDITLIQPELHELHLNGKYLGEDIINSRLSDEGTEYHSYEANLNNPDIVETVTYIKNDQKLFTYAGYVDTPQNGILMLVNDRNMGSNAYIPTILGGEGIKIRDYLKLKPYVDEFFKENGYDYVDYYFASIYEGYEEDVQYMLFLTQFSIFTLLLNLVFLFLALFSFVSIYFDNYKRKNAVLKFMGFSFRERHRAFFVKFSVLNLAMTVLCLVIVKIAERRIMNLHLFAPMLLVYFLFILLHILLVSYILQRKEKFNMIQVLKGE